MANVSQVAVEEPGCFGFAAGPRFCSRSMVANLRAITSLVRHDNDCKDLHGEYYNTSYHIYAGRVGRATRLRTATTSGRGLYAALGREQGRAARRRPFVSYRGALLVDLIHRVARLRLGETRACV